MRFSIFQESRQGGRSNNEDRVAYCYSRDALLMVVADGMGGHQHGEIASQIAVQTLTATFQREALPRVQDPYLCLQKAMVAAHNSIAEYTVKRQLPECPRTTCVACIIQDNIACWAHVGDSRLYLLRAGKVLARTRDHSHVQLLVDEGLISPARAATHPERNKVYSCLGGKQLPDIEFSYKTPLQAGDTLLLCTDGLWGVLTSEEIVEGLRDGDLNVAVPALMTEAEILGGVRGDNLSVVVTRWEDTYVRDAETTVFTKSEAMSDMTTVLHELDYKRPHGQKNTAGPKKDDFSERDIEQAIQEIQAAIDRNQVATPARLTGTAAASASAPAAPAALPPGATAAATPAPQLSIDTTAKNAVTTTVVKMPGSTISAATAAVKNIAARAGTVSTAVTRLTGLPQNTPHPPQPPSPQTPTPGHKK